MTETDCLLVIVDGNERLKRKLRQSRADVNLLMLALWFVVVCFVIMFAIVYSLSQLVDLLVKHICETSSEFIESCK